MTDDFHDLEELVPATEVFELLASEYDRKRNGCNFEQSRCDALLAIVSRLESGHTFAWATSCEIDSCDPRTGQDGQIFNPLDFYVKREPGRVPIEFWSNFRSAPPGGCSFDEVTGDFRFAFSDDDFRWRNGTAFGVYLHRRGLPPVSIPSWTNSLTSAGQVDGEATASIQAPAKRNGGRGPARWWPEFAEELAMYCLKEDPPEGTGTEGQSEMIQAIFERMAERGKAEPSRSTVQPVINAILLRWRSAGN